LPRVQRQGIGTEMVAMAIREARKAGCEWLHVDFEARLRRFYLEKCGFESTNGGLIRL
jgi:tRNA(Met) C34 N-acetyltransferase TmcA